jgi:hypothetical protein
MNLDRHHVVSCRVDKDFFYEEICILFRDEK